MIDYVKKCDKLPQDYKSSGARLFYIILFTSFITSFSFAQRRATAIDTAYFYGDYRIKLCCTKKSIAVIDLISLEDTTRSIHRLYFSKIQNKNLEKLSTNDTIQIDYKHIYRRTLSGPSRYLTQNMDGTYFYIYTSSYKDRWSSFFFIEDDIISNYYISKRCPRSVLRRYRGGLQRLRYMFR